METEKLIDYRLYNPTKSLFGNKNDKAEFRQLFCSNDDCNARNNGQCTMWSLSGGKCPYGRMTFEKGFTRRARKFRSWINEREKQVEGIKQLRECSKMEQIGEYIYFNYPYWYQDYRIERDMKNGTLPERKTFYTYDEFTVEFFQRIINAYPQAIFGGTITDFQKKTVPEIIMHCEEQLPEFFNQWSKKYPDTAKRFEKKDYKGRTALLNTIRPGAVFHENGEKITWDGSELIMNDYSSVFLPVNNGPVTVKIVPSPETTIKITNNDQVSDETIFKD